MGYRKYVKELYRDSKRLKAELGDTLVERKKQWRREDPVVRIDKPTRIDRARQYGYRAKQGFIMARVRVRTGGLRKSRPSRGRKPAGMAVRKITPAKSIQRVAEERAQKKFTNLQVLASYWVMEDGKHNWYEVIMVDPAHPAIKKDKKVGWMSTQHKKRVFRGKTPAGRKGRGLRRKGRGAEKVRPSLRAKGRKAK